VSERLVVGRRVLTRVVVPGAVIYVVLVGVGLLLVHPLARLGPVEDGVNRELAADRSPVLNTVTSLFGTLANTPAVVGVVFGVAIALRVVYGRWRESIILVTAVLLQAVVFLLTTLVIDRPRPDVQHLDAAPPTSSFPSGHAGAGTALYVGLAVVVAWRLRRRLWRVLLAAALTAIPLLVGVSRLYRGMHHPTDVVFGLLNGLACLIVAIRAFPPGVFAWTPPHPRRRDASPSSPTGRNPSTVGSTNSES
jgi:membrane-associated phospholipid phosphatase